MKLVYLKVNTSYAFTLVDQNAEGEGGGELFYSALCDQQSCSDFPLQFLVDKYKPNLLYLLNNTQHSLQLPENIQVINYQIEQKETLVKTCQLLFPSDDYVPLLQEHLLVDMWQSLGIQQLFDLFKDQLTCSQSQQTLQEFFMHPIPTRGEGKLEQLIKDYDQLEQVRQQMRKISVPPQTGVWRTVQVWERLIQSLQAIAQIADVDINVLETMSAEIIKIIDFDEPLVKKGVNVQLDNLKYYYHFQMEQDIKQVGQENLGTQAQVVYQVQLGFFAVSSHESELFGEFKFQKDGKFYYKNAVVEELDNEIGDIGMNIIDMEMEEVTKLQEFIQNNLNAISYSQLVDQIFEYDCLMAYAAVAIKYNYVKPEFQENGVLFIEKGRHPVLEHEFDYVPNDIELNKCLMVTGPNSSGKSCYLKQTGLIVFMAHIGSYVPAAKCQLGQYGAIITRIVTGESSAVHKSAFKIDLDQMSMAIKACKQPKRVLVLVDEFAKGTTVEDGIGTFAATVNYLNKYQQMQLIVCTHYHQAVQFLDDSYIEYIQMLEYKVKPGRASSSYGVYCASVAGVPKMIVERAAEVNECLAQMTQIAPLLNHQDQAYEEAAIELMETFLSHDINVEELFGVMLKPFTSSASSLVTCRTQI